MPLFLFPNSSLLFSLEFISSCNIVTDGNFVGPQNSKSYYIFLPAYLMPKDVVARLNSEGVRTHLRKADHYSGNVLDPLGLDSCIRVSMCHYNSAAEVAQFLGVMKNITSPN